MVNVLIWYLLVSTLGLAAWPLLFRLLPGLPDRGYTFSRAAGLLLVGYVFWLLVSLGLLRNTVGGMLFALAVVVGVAIWQYHTKASDDTRLLDWVKSNCLLLVLGELLFALAFVGWAIVRAHNPELNATERPMELAFINGIRASAIFPPQDPWLAGYGISYYYFGYVMAAMLADLSGLATAVAFNLMIALLFALTLLGSYGLVYNLIALANSDGKLRMALFALLGPILVGVMGNLEGALELIRGLRLLPAAFWAWLDIPDISTLPETRLWPPSNWRFWWWWRASRVIHDRDLTGASIGLQPIDEFPMFSFLLGDMHPHVLALPFALLALGLALNLLAQHQKLSREQFVFYALGFGGLAFLNTWDVLFYLFILVGARALWEWQRCPGRAAVWGALTFAFWIIIAGGLAYLPWYISFSSQAGGILPNALFPTRLHQFAVMFGTVLFIVICYLVGRALDRETTPSWQLGGGLSLGVLIGLTVLMGIMGYAAIFGVPGIPGLSNTDAQNFLLASTGQTDLRLASDIVLHYRLISSWTALLLTSILGLTLALLLGRTSAWPPASRFVLLLILTGTLLTLGPEFLYLRDVFGQRLNTIFKFYYATWLLWGIAGAYALYRLGQKQTTGRWIFLGLASLLIAAGLVYPVLAILEKTEYFSEAPTLNGIAYIRQQNPSDYNAILWIQENLPPDAIILEAVGGSYTYYGRISSTTGRPTLLGWPGHELQWRGTLEIAGNRQEDVRTIYSTPDINLALNLLRQYGVNYVYVGSLERDPEYSTPEGIEKFERYLDVVYSDGSAAVYRVEE